MKRWIRVLVLPVFTACFADDEPRIASDSEFPAKGQSQYFAGEITLVEHVNRKGILRLDRDGTLNKYHWDLPHHFQMLPYGSIRYHGAAARLSDIPLGTHLHGEFYLGPEGDFEVTPPVSNYFAGRLPKPDLRSTVSKYSRVLRFEDDFSFYRRHGSGWKILTLSEDGGSMSVQLVSLEDGKPVPKGEIPGGLEGELTLRLDSATGIWKGRSLAALSDLAVGQIIQTNLSWVTLLGSEEQDALCRDIWIDEESRAVAADRQSSIYQAVSKRHGVPALVIGSENNPEGGTEGRLTVELAAGIDPEIVEGFKESRGFSVVVAEPTLRTYRMDYFKSGSVEEIIEIENPPPGSSGVRFELKMYEMLEGHRQGRTVLLADREWNLLERPYEEKLNPKDARIFSVGPPEVSGRDGYEPPGSTGASE